MLVYLHFIPRPGMVGMRQECVRLNDIIIGACETRHRVRGRDIAFLHAAGKRTRFYQQLGSEQAQKSPACSYPFPTDIRGADIDSRLLEFVILRRL